MQLRLGVSPIVLTPIVQMLLADAMSGLNYQPFVRAD